MRAAHVVVTMLVGQAVFYGLVWAGTVPLGIDDPVGDAVWLAASVVAAGYTMFRALRWHERQNKIEADRAKQVH